MATKYIPLGPGENARFLRSKKIKNQEFADKDLLQYDESTKLWTPSTNITLTELTVDNLVATTTITTGDNLIVLNDDVTGDPTEDAGIEVNRGDSTDARLIWNETKDHWEAGEVGSLSVLLKGDNYMYSNGFTDTSKVAVSYEESTRVFTVNVAANAEYWSNGVRYIDETGTDYQTSAHADTTGNYWLYFRDASLTVSNSPDILQDALLAYVYYNATTNKAILFNEKHPGATWPASVHKYSHETRGAVLESGGLLADYTLSDFTDYAYSISTAEVHDENLEHSLSSLASGGPYSVFYRSGSDANNEWSWDITPTIPVLDDGDDIYYNELSGGTWSQTAVTNNYYVNYWLLALPVYNDSGDNWKLRFAQLMGQAEHFTLEGALEEDINTDVAFGDVGFQEAAPLYRLTYRCFNNGAGKDIQLVNVTRIAGETIEANIVGTPSDHNTLSNRDANASHPASAISVNAEVTANLVSTNVQAALVEVADAASQSGGGLTKWTESANGDLTADEGNTLSINIAPNTTTNGPGNGLILQPGKGDGTGSGGDLKLYPGEQGDTIVDLNNFDGSAIKMYGERSVSSGPTHNWYQAAQVGTSSEHGNYMVTLSRGDPTFAIGFTYDTAAKIVRFSSSGATGTDVIQFNAGASYVTGTWECVNNSDLGSNSYDWKDLYLGGVLKIGNVQVVGSQGGAIVSLAGGIGTGDDALVAVSGSGDDSTINNNFEDCRDKIEEILSALRTHGLIAT